MESSAGGVEAAMTAAMLRGEGDEPGGGDLSHSGTERD